MMAEKKPVLDAFHELAVAIKGEAQAQVTTQEEKAEVEIFCGVIDNVFDMAVAFYNVALAIGFQRAKEELDNGNNGSGGADREGEGERSDSTGAGVPEVGGSDHEDQGEQGAEPEGLREPAGEGAEHGS